jgi:DNA repair protein RadC
MAPVKPLLVLQPAVLLGANAIIFAHNHPSGDLEPSAEDKKLADTLCAACTLLGLRLLDNIIWTEAGSTSYGPYAR